MGWQTDIFPLLIVVSGAPNTGLFVYNASGPGKGNLVAAIVAPGTTSDSYGNAVSAVANFGTWNAAGTLLQHFGVNNSGDTFLVNNAGKIIQHARSSDGSTFFYNTSGEGAGNLTDSIAAVGGTIAGNTFFAGVVNYSTPVNAIAQLLNGLLNVGTAGQLAGTGGATPGQVGLVTGNPGVVRMDSGLTATGDTDSFVDARSKNAQSAISLVAQRNVALAGPLALGIEAAPLQLAQALLFDTGSGYAKMLSAVANDTNVYSVSRLEQVLGSAFTINSTTPQAIFTVALGLGVYLIDIWGVTSNTTPADAAQFAFAFTGTVAAPVLLDYETISGTGPATVNYTASATLTQVFNGQAVAGNQQLLVHLTMNVSVAGTLTFTGAELFPLNTITVFAGSRMQVRPQ